MRRVVIIVTFVVGLLGLALGQDWSCPLTVYSGERDYHTTLTFGVDYRGTDCYDDGLDVPWIPTPWGFAAYFVPPCTEGLPPGTNYLTTDYRSSDSLVEEWIIRVSGDPSPNPRLVVWDHTTLPVEAPESTLFRALAWAEEMKICQRTEYSTDYPPDDEWVDMTTTDSFFLNPGNEAVLRVTMVGGVDHNPPVVTNEHPEPGAVSVPRNDSIAFNITDDVAGVDVTTLWVLLEFPDTSFEITDDGTLFPIPGGYHFLYIYPDTLPGDADICVYVWAMDLADSAHAMDTVSWCFHTREEPPMDCDPPTFPEDEWTTGDGEPIDIHAIDTLDAHDAVIFTVRDGGGAGVDESTIQVIVDGVDWTSSCDITRIGVTYDYMVTVPPCPLSGWTGGTTHEIVVSACDRAGPPCGPNCADPLTVVFYVVGDTLSAWTMSVDVNSDAGPSVHLTFGMHEDGSEYYDPGLDQAYPGTPGFYAYFPLSDPSHPDITMLSKDIRALHAGVEFWEIHMEAASGECSISWDPTAIPALGGCYMLDLYVGHGPEGGSIDWTDMRTAVSVDVAPEDIIYLKAQVRDTCTGAGTRPYITNLDPPAGATDVPVGAIISFDIRDDIGIIDTSIHVYFTPGGDYTDYITLTPLVNGYHVECDPPGLLVPATTYEVHVIARDLDLDTHTLDTTYSFTTAGPCAPMFSLNITAVDSSSAEVKTSVVTIGTDSAATDGFDPGLDVYAPPPIDFYAYIAAVADTIYDQYATDIRNNCAAEGHVWEIHLGNVSGDVQWVEWSSALVPYDDLWKLLVAVSSSGLPTDCSAFSDMRDINRVEVGSDEVVYVWLTTSCGPTTYSVFGTVTDCITGLPVEGAQVDVGGLVDFTDSLGQFEVSGLFPATYDVSITASGYEEFDTSVTIVDADVELSVSICPPSYVVSGTTFVEGVATGGVEVQIGPATPVYSGADGYYEVRLTAGTYEVRASYPGYPVYVDTIDVSSDLSYNIYIEAGTFTISGFGMLEGEASAGISISVDGSPAATTDDTGYYEIEVPYGVHTISASYPGYETVDTTLLVDSDLTLDFDLSPSCVQVCVDVTVEGASDNSGALVEMPPEEALVTPPSGLVCFDCVDWGDYTITVSKENYCDAETAISVSAPETVEITLPFAWPVTDLEALVVPDTRPLSEDLHVVLSWTAPTSSYLTVESYDIYRNDSLIATVDTAGYEDYDVADGDVHTYYVVVNYAEGCSSPASDAVIVDVSVSPDPNEILVVDFDNGAGFTEDLTAVLDDILVDASYTVTAQDEDITAHYDLGDYDAVIVVLGVRGDASDDVMPSEMVDMLTAYIDEGGKVYVEGPDFAQDYDGTEFLDRFSFSATDGNPSSTGNVEYVVTDDAFFGGAMWTMDYPYQTDADHYVDRLTPLGGAAPMLYANDDSVVVGVYYLQRYYTSIYITELSVDGYPAPNRVLGEILEHMGFETTGIAEHASAKPSALAVSAKPNPFNAACDVTFDLPSAASVELAVYDVSGAKVATLYAGKLSQGRYTVTWDATGLASGVYVVKLSANGYSTSTRVTLIK